ncbi:hypothetical protein X947_4620 [Burkholderia pseudomallei MSHR7334]|nr:hypothetical protein X947_4620 [Burkholderia pseudomallei MSHR7334]
MPLLIHGDNEPDCCSTLRNQLELVSDFTDPLRVFPDANRLPPSPGNPTLTLASDGGFDALAFGVRFLMRADHHQQAINEVHRLRFKTRSVVLTAITRSHNRDPGIDNLRELGLRLNGFGSAESIETLNN